MPEVSPILHQYSYPEKTTHVKFQSLSWEVCHVVFSQTNHHSWCLSPSECYYQYYQSSYIPHTTNTNTNTNTTNHPISHIRSFNLNGKILKVKMCLQNYTGVPFTFNMEKNPLTTKILHWCRGVSDKYQSSHQFTCDKNRRVRDLRALEICLSWIGIGYLCTACIDFEKFALKVAISSKNYNHRLKTASPIQNSVWKLIYVHRL